MKSIRAVLATLLLAIVLETAHAARASDLPTVGLIYFGDVESSKPYDQAFRQGLESLGYIEGKNIKMEPRYANGDADRLQVFIRELIGIPVDVLLVTNKSLHAAVDATKSVPIICPTMSDPVRDGLVASFARPGGNLTGGYALVTETDAKRFELLKEIVPRLKRLGILLDSTDPSLVLDGEALRALARKGGVTATIYQVQDADELKVALNRIADAHPEALTVFHSPLTVVHRKAIMGSIAHRIPTITEGRDLVEAGALLGYAPSYPEMFRRSASYVDKILKGVKPGDLPIEQPTKFDLIVNLRTARALGIRIPEHILLRADETFR